MYMLEGCKFQDFMNKVNIFHCKDILIADFAQTRYWSRFHDETHETIETFDVGRNAEKQK